MRYGVLLDVASAVWAGEPVDLRTGYANMIWQGDANAVALRALALASNPPLVLNVTGPEQSPFAPWPAVWPPVRQNARFLGAEQPDALLSNASLAHRLFGLPRAPLAQIIAWTADWVRNGGRCCASRLISMYAMGSSR